MRWAYVGLTVHVAAWGGSARGREPPPRPRAPAHSPAWPCAHPHPSAGGPAGRLRWVKVAPAGPFPHSRREFLETVILNQEPRRLIYACTMQLSTHTHTGAVVHICTRTYAVFGEYLTPTTHSQELLISFRGSQVHLLTGLFLDTHQLTIHRAAFTCTRALKSPGTLG